MGGRRRPRAFPTDFRCSPCQPTDSVGMTARCTGFGWGHLCGAAQHRLKAYATRLAYIREIEYSNVLQNLLQSYKASVFQALSHPTRIAILELLREGELSAGKLQERLGIEQANLSQHLAILRSRQLVVNRKEGNQVFYSAKSPVLLDILDILRQHFQANLAEAIQILETTEAATATMSQKTLPASEAAFLKATERDR